MAGDRVSTLCVCRGPLLDSLTHHSYSEGFWRPYPQSDACVHGPCAPAVSPALAPAAHCPHPARQFPVGFPTFPCFLTTFTSAPSMASPVAPARGAFRPGHWLTLPAPRARSLCLGCSVRWLQHDLGLPRSPSGPPVSGTLVFSFQSITSGVPFCGLCTCGIFSPEWSFFGSFPGRLLSNI